MNVRLICPANLFKAIILQVQAQVQVQVQVLQCLQVQAEQRGLQLSEPLLVLALQLFCSQLLQEIKKRRIA
jgi:hypothetical protein